MLDILDIINEATKEANSFENHPAKDLSLEERLLYLQGIALVMNADGMIHPEEKEFIRILIKSFEMDESILESVVEFAQCPDKDTVQAFFRTFRRRPISQLFLFDALVMTRRDENVDERENAVVDKIAEQLEVLKGTYQDIFDLFCHIKNKDWEESSLYFSSHLLNPEYFRHLLDYYEVDFEGLLERTKNIRNKRVLEIFKSRVNSLSESNEMKITLNNDVVLPIIQSGIDRGEVKVFMGKIIFPEEKECELSTVGFGYHQESKSLYLVNDENISDRIIISFVSNYLNISNIEMFEFLFDSNNIIHGEIDKVSNRKLKLSTNFENGKFIAIANKLFQYINNGKYDIFGNDEIYSSKIGVDFYEYIYQEKKNEKGTMASLISSSFFSRDGDIFLDYGLDDQDSKGSLKEVDLL
ncbi:TerB family tellurite resistance protein [Vibrio sp. Y176]|uniref:TerB family tellurite resistance protein n=1 Tax=Vibrio sp. Y176 TaxID=3074704 RepID=UPI0029658416|nr:TerB family tellurite resistance protein [Vibrio sp. Y176]MDW1627196.1 TerB family tellurite resistance protein [Vibrio sp. Y176]